MNTTGHDEATSAVAAAETASERWADATRLQRWAPSDHSDFYALAGEMVATVNGLVDMTTVLTRHVERYGSGRRIYDDTRVVDPTERLQEAAEYLRGLRDVLAHEALREAHGFWSAIGHIGVEDVTP